jgi:hypothetical protein
MADQIANQEESTTMGASEVTKATRISVVRDRSDELLRHAQMFGVGHGIHEEA